MFRSCLRLLAVLILWGMVSAAFAGGPRWVAGSSYFDASVKGKPLHWKDGVISYYVDPAALSNVGYHTLVVSVLATVANVWNSVPTAAVKIAYAGNLSEDVSGTNVTVSASGAVNLPADIQSTATNRPLGIVFDTDGSVIDAIYGKGASDPGDCRDNAVMTVVDNVAADGTIQHALMILNGLCAQNNGQFQIMQYQMLRGFGRILGLDWSQANESMFVNDQITAEGVAGWPIMHPVEYLCSITGVTCTTNGLALRYDDIASVSRLYPVSEENLGSFPGKSLTAKATISVQGRIHFQNGQGMQGVNVVLRPLKPGTDTPDLHYTVTAVSGALFQGQAANPVNGPKDSQGNPRNRYGSDDVSLEGWFDLSGAPLPVGQTVADYQLSFEPINPLYTDNYSVGPYTQGQVAPSGTMPVITLHGLAAGTQVLQDVVIQDSASEPYDADDGMETEPVRIAPSGEWTGRISGYGHTAWFGYPVRAHRQLTVEGTALNETGMPAGNKARVVLGAWNGTDAAGSSPVVETPQAFNGDEVGLTTLSVRTSAAGSLRIGVADNRGDGRPDYLYRGRLLYADSVTPARLALAGGPIVIRGVGFRANAIVTVNGVNAPVTSVTPTEITAIAPPANGASGAVMLTVSDPATLGVASIEDGLSYDAMGGDALGIVTAPMGAVGLGMPQPFTVRALAADGETPAAGVIVTFSVTNGAALLGCGAAVCNVTAGEDGMASLSVTAVSPMLAQITAFLSDGASVLAEFTGSAIPLIDALTPNLYVAIGASLTWEPRAQLLSNGIPLVGQAVNWSAGSGVIVQQARTASGSNGVAGGQVLVSALGADADVSIRACLPGDAVCAPFHVYSVHPETALLMAVSGVGQVLFHGEAAAPAILRVTDAVGHPMAGARVTFYETLKPWTPDCPPSGRCPAAPVLSTQTVQAISDTDGRVTLMPLAGSGVASRLYVTAVTGNEASMDFEIDTRP